MLSFLSWYITITALGLLIFPLTCRLFPALADRGYSLARVFGLLVWGYGYWMLASLGIARNDAGGLVLAWLVVLCVGAWSLFRFNGQKKPGFQWQGLIQWLKTNWRLVVTVEVLFFVSFAFLAIVRAAYPDIVGTEKPMELAFINAILRSPTFPPQDPWLSGYAISYYYFGYLMTAMLARLTQVPGSVAFILMVSLIFALSAIGAYGIVYNLLAARRSKHRVVNQKPDGSFMASVPLLGPLFLLLVSNLEGFLEILHKGGLFWRSASDGSLVSPFWRWLDMKELSQPPVPPLDWLPSRYLWWWRASRVVQDYDLAGNVREVIDEFPFFSYLLADLHPHVLAMPFALLAIAVALNLYLGGWDGEHSLVGFRLKIQGMGFFFIALVVGGLAFLNTWDILVAFLLVVGAYFLNRLRQAGLHLNRLVEAFEFSILLGLVAILLYLPFYLGFSSQAGGILPNLINPTRGVHLWVMFGSLLIPIFAYLIYLWRVEKIKVNWFQGFGLALGVALLLWGFSWLFIWVISLIVEKFPGLASTLAAAAGSLDIRMLFLEGSSRRLSYGGGFITLLLLLGMGLAFLFVRRKKQTQEGLSFDLDSPILRGDVNGFVLLLVILGTLAVLVPEFVFLRDQFSTRMNTVFKFYYQAWIVWSVAAAFGVAIILRNLRRAGKVLFCVGFSILLVVSLTYPVLGILDITNQFDPPFGWTLDGAVHLNRENPDDASAIRWLQSAPYGVVAEAVSYASYSYYGRISTHTGLPTILGWPGHEGQWRGGYEEQGSREADIRLLYETGDWLVARDIIEQYDIRYIVIGNLERSTYQVQEAKLMGFLQPVFRADGLVIYRVP